MPTSEGRAPRVLIVMPDQWRRALLRAALREVGYDAIGARGLREALLVPSVAADRGPVAVIVVDQEALLADTAALRARHGNPPMILLARATVEPPEGEWRRVLRRPFTVEDLIVATQSVAPLPASGRRPVDEPPNAPR